jgi:hypothetical protein
MDGTWSTNREYEKCTQFFLLGRDQLYDLAINRRIILKLS